ncbi:MAG: sodium:solute symporter family protein [Hyphomicrobiaceae bacterium]
MNAIVIGVAAYVALQFAIGAWVSRRIKSETDYILAGRQLGVGLAAFSIFATWFGAETVLGSAGRVYKDGLAGAQGEPFAYAAAIVIMGLLLARPLWRRGLVTFADFFRQRFSPGVETVATLLLIPGTVIWVAAQIRGFGQIMSTTAGMDIALAMTLAAVAVVAYTMLGGLLADVYTDLLQGSVIIAGLLAVFVVIVVQLGGVAQGLASIDPARLKPMTPDQPLLDFIEQWAIPICGSLVAIELISRILACRSPEVARAAAGTGGLVYFLVALVPVFLGLVGPNLVPGLSDGEQVIPALAKAYFPTILYVVFAGALISAILSTVDSALLAAAALVSHNLVQRVHPGLTESRKLLLTRTCVAGLGIVAYVWALGSTSIASLVEQASAFATAGIFVVTIMGMFTRVGGPLAAYAAMATGALVWLIGSKEYGMDWSVPYLKALAAAVVIYLAGALIERRHAG